MPSLISVSNVLISQKDVVCQSVAVFKIFYKLNQRFAIYFMVEKQIVKALVISKNLTVGINLYSFSVRL